VLAGLEHAEPVKGRQIATRLANGATLVDDSYNANPGSVAAAIATLAQGEGEGWLVLGDMAELGPEAESLHAQIGAQARAAGLARLWTVGNLTRAASAAFGPAAAHFSSQGELLEALREALARHPDAGRLRLLVKGSRSSAMDKVVAALQADAGDGHAA
jgi:UDP-N-acetylmuramoyl-tripeptide--D-alanyl-D-alanine ligase